MERIAAAAFRHPVTGEITTGVTHLEAWPGGPEGIDALCAQLGPDVYLAEGFMTDTGRFVDRKEALAIAAAANQHDRDEQPIHEGHLHSEEVVDYAV